MQDFRLQFAQHYIDLYITLTIQVLNMTHLGNKQIDICTWTTVGTRIAKNRGQELGHVAKMYDFRLHFALLWTYNFHYFRSKYDLSR